MTKRWCHFEVWIEHDDTEPDRVKLRNLWDTIFEFIDEGCNDLGFDPHAHMSLSEDAPEWATEMPLKG